MSTILLSYAYKLRKFWSFCSNKYKQLIFRPGFRSLAGDQETCQYTLAQMSQQENKCFCHFSKILMRTRIHFQNSTHKSNPQIGMAVGFRWRKPPKSDGVFRSLKEHRVSCKTVDILTKNENPLIRLGQRSQYTSVWSERVLDDDSLIVPQHDYAWKTMHSLWLIRQYKNSPSIPKLEI